MTRRKNPEWSDPTAEAAISKLSFAGKEKTSKPPPTNYQGVEFLSRFNTPSESKERRRLIKNLNKEIDTLCKDDPMRIELSRKRARLEAQQFASRVSSDVFKENRRHRKAILHSLRP